MFPTLRHIRRNSDTFSEAPSRWPKGSLIDRDHGPGATIDDP
jgi:hypothetical protein